jgi:hypothetical protein
MGMNGKRKAIAFALSLCFVAAPLFSGAFISANAGHSHNQGYNNAFDYYDDHYRSHNCANDANNNCAVCLQITVAVNALTQTAGMSAAAAPSAFENLFAALIIHKFAFSRFDFSSPITLHVRLNN